MFVIFSCILPIDYKRRYEDLVGDPEKALKNILASLELDWQQLMLNFYETKRVVFTQSQQRKLANDHSARLLLH